MEHIKDKSSTINYITDITKIHWLKKYFLDTFLGVIFKLASSKWQKVKIFILDDKLLTF